MWNCGAGEDYALRLPASLCVEGSPWQVSEAFAPRICSLLGPRLHACSHLPGFAKNLTLAGAQCPGVLGKNSGIPLKEATRDVL